MIIEPSEIIEQLKETRRIEANLTDSTVRQKLYNLRKSKGEKVTVFCGKFDNLIRQYETCNKIIGEDEKRAIFEHAVTEAHPDLPTAIFVKNQTGTVMTTNDMKSFLLQLEAKNQINLEAKAATLLRQQHKAPANDPELAKVKCHRCNKHGNYQTDCPLKD
ncbi:hypothetical protein TSAR_003733 [Trichomalopsis sarcophagae]|uniref:CCHC-type domain-containing protein n=1 Tax=Trichomalopsis sarcophagae TaxID=543379 RepID=A0A232EQ72_9HYME|nr:hypothetical protein TSAR_003733 [Trichomalopsis sarcophagae]